MRVSLSIFGLSFLVLLFSPSFCLAENYWQAYESTAHTSVSLRGNRGQALASFIISFKNNTECQMEIAFMLTKNGDQGTYIERRSTKENMVLNIDGTRYS
jgi:hypothetical protein